MSKPKVIRISNCKIKADDRLTDNLTSPHLELFDRLRKAGVAEVVGVYFRLDVNGTWVITPNPDADQSGYGLRFGV